MSCHVDIPFNRTLRNKSYLNEILNNTDQDTVYKKLPINRKLRNLSPSRSQSPISLSRVSSFQNMYKPRISFDTVALDIGKAAPPVTFLSMDLDSMTSDEYHNTEDLHDLSPHESSRDGFKMRLGFGVSYPTTPTIDSTSVAIKRSHPDYAKRQAEVIASRNEFQKVATRTQKVKLVDNTTKDIVSPEGFRPGPRIILCPISGKQHSWVALDYTVTRLLKDLDHLVVVASVPYSALYHRRRHSRSRSRSRSRLPEEVPSNEDKQLDQEATSRCQKVAQEIMDYLYFILDPSLVIKITVEIDVGTTKEMLDNAYKVHTPQMVVLSSKKRGIVDWSSRKVSDQLIKFYPIPVVVVPRMNPMEKKLLDRIEDELDLEDSDTQTNHAEEEVDSDIDSEEEMDRIQLKKSLSVSSNVVPQLRKSLSAMSISSASSVDSEDSIDLIVDTLEDTANDLQLKINMATSRPLNPHTFSTLLDVVTKSSIETRTRIENLSCEHSEGQSRLNELKRVISGQMVQKKTSMLDMPVSKPKKKTVPPMVEVSPAPPENRQIQFAPPLTRTTSVTRSVVNQMRMNGKETLDINNSFRPVKSHDDRERSPLVSETSSISSSASKKSFIGRLFGSSKVSSDTSLDKKSKRKSLFRS